MDLFSLILMAFLKYENDFKDIILFPVRTVNLPSTVPCRTYMIWSYEMCLAETNLMAPRLFLVRATKFFRGKTNLWRNAQPSFGQCVALLIQEQPDLLLRVCNIAQVDMPIIFADFKLLKKQFPQFNFSILFVCVQLKKSDHWCFSILYSIQLTHIMWPIASNHLSYDLHRFQR